MAPPDDNNNKNNTDKPRVLKQHGVKGVYYGGNWVDIEECDKEFSNPTNNNCSGCTNSKEKCPRSRSRNADLDQDDYDIVIVGAGCVGAAIARELSKYDLNILWVEAADDVSQGATKGNSGIVHAGYDDKPGTNRAKYCWPGNQMFPQLDKELRFGYQLNGSMVLALNEDEMKILEDLKKRGETNGVKRLKIIDQKELRQMEPYVNPNAIGALYAPDAGNVIPYEFTIALAENAVDNGVELRIRRQVTNIEKLPKEEGNKQQQQQQQQRLKLTMNYWEPKPYVNCKTQGDNNIAIMKMGVAGMLWAVAAQKLIMEEDYNMSHVLLCILAPIVIYLIPISGSAPPPVTNAATMAKMVQDQTKGGNGKGQKVQVDDMLIGGSGAPTNAEGVTIATEEVTAKYVINCAGGASDQIAQMVGDTSFKIKPRLGDYLLLNRNQGYLASHTLFPCPDPVLGKGVLVQTTLWGNLILGPTARDMYKPEARDMSSASVQDYILQHCKKLVPNFDAKEIFHAFAGSRAKSDRGDWIIEICKTCPEMIHIAGIDSPGLAGSPAIAVEAVRLLKEAGLKDMPKNKDFNPNRAPIISPKNGMKGLKMGPIGKNDVGEIKEGDDMTELEKQMAANVICKCEKVTELEVVRAMRRSLPIDSSQGIRKRTRAGMGHCQGDPDNYACEARVRAIIARENGVPIDEIGGRPWPATSTLSKRWIDDKEKETLAQRKEG